MKHAGVGQVQVVRRGRDVPHDKHIYQVLYFEVNSM